MTAVDTRLRKVEFFRETGARLRYWLHCVFPNVGLYEIRIFIKAQLIITFYIDNKVGNSGLPFLNYSAGDSEFVPINRRAGLTETDNGVGLIRFVAFTARSKVVCEV
jgi:hypothetical protein